MIFGKYHPPYPLTSPLKDRPQVSIIWGDLGWRVLRCAKCTPQIPISNRVSSPHQAEMDHAPLQTSGVWRWDHLIAKTPHLRGENSSKEAIFGGYLQCEFKFAPSSLKWASLRMIYWNISSSNIVNTPLNFWFTNSNSLWELEFVWLTKNSNRSA